MTTLTIGNLRVRATPFDYWSEALLINAGRSKLPKHAQVLVQHFRKSYGQRVLAHDCTKPVWTRNGVDAQDRLIVKQEFKLVGVEPSGRPTQKATLALLNAYVQAAGLSGPNAFGQTLDSIFGLHAVTVPRAKWATPWEPRYSIDIFAYIKMEAFRLWIPGQDPRSYVLVAVPYLVQFQGLRTFDCQTKKTISFDFEYSFTDEEDLVPPDRDVHVALRPRLRSDLRHEQEQLDHNRIMRDLSAGQLEQDPDNPRWKEQLEDYRDRVKDREENIARIERRLAELERE